MTITRLVAILLLAGGALGCRGEAGVALVAGDAAGAAIALESVPGPACLRVPLRETIEAVVSVRNPTSAALTVSGWRASCSCIRIGAMPKRVRLGSGDVARIPLFVEGLKTGMKEEEILLLAEHGSGAKELVRVPVLVITGPPLFTEPKALQLSGRAGEWVPGFSVLSHLERRESVELFWEADDGIALELGETTEETALVGWVTRFPFRARLPQRPPGTYTTSITFRRGEGARIQRSIVLLITP